MTVDGSALDLVEAGQRAVVAHGGRGGHGNKRFANSTRQAPRFAEKGTGGEEGWIELRLKLLADAGLIGLPNAGKSSLLGRLTRAAPKVADYPFTTISPALGVMDGDDRQAVVADIPGLIEGAAEGAGLGHEFLAHVERCAMLVHLVDLAPLEGDPVQLRVRAGRARHLRGGPRPAARAGRPLQARPAAPLTTSAWRSGMEAATGRPCGRGAGGLLGDRRGAGRRCARRSSPSCPTAPPVALRRAEAPAGFEVEHRVYRPAGEGGYSVQREPDGGFRVLGRGVELLFERHDIANEESLAYLESRLNEIGVIAALRAAGFEARRRRAHRRARVRAAPLGSASERELPREEGDDRRLHLLRRVPHRPVAAFLEHDDLGVRERSASAARRTRP